MKKDEYAYITISFLLILIIQPFTIFDHTGAVEERASASIDNPLSVVLKRPGDDPVKGDEYLRALLKRKYLIDIGAKGPDNSTGLGFLTYLNSDEFDDLWKQA